MYLNFGCGTNKIDKFINIDICEKFEPDLVLDLENLPLPFESGTVEQITMLHFLEHVFPDTKQYGKFWSEIYRICKNDASIFIEIPYHGHWTYRTDPTHVRAIHPYSFYMMDKTCSEQRDLPTETKLYELWDVNFEVKEVVLHCDESCEPVVYRCVLQKVGD